MPRAFIDLHTRSRHGKVLLRSMGTGVDGAKQKESREEIIGDLPQRQIAVSTKSSDKITGRGARIVQVETDGGQRRINGGLPQ